MIIIRCKIHIWHINANFQFFGSRMAPKWLRNGSEWLISYSVAQTSFKFGTDDIYQLSNVQITSWCLLSIFWLHIGSEMAPKWLRMAHFLFYCSDIIQIWHRWCLPVKWCANNVLVFTFYFLAPYWLQNGSEWLFLDQQFGPLKYPPSVRLSVCPSVCDKSSHTSHHRIS